MKNRLTMVVLSLLLLAGVFSVSSCAKLFGPSDQEVVQAINNTGLFSGGVEKFSLKSPIQIVDRGSKNADDSWPVTVKMTLTFTPTGGKESKPMEKTSVFKLYKSKDSSGKITWTAK